MTASPFGLIFGDAVTTPPSTHAVEPVALARGQSLWRRRPPAAAPPAPLSTPPPSATSTAAETARASAGAPAQQASATSKNKYFLTSIFELCLLCSSESLDQRMAMNDVVAKLKGIKKDYSASMLAMQRPQQY
uniref:Uncharacterized protein n=1 Tax=Oryza sativa subsp. indica TaxID=39946 RepID=A0A679B9K3_ORYSI|nr:hypothetical protein [Oryza sativa Indica Group]